MRDKAIELRVVESSPLSDELVLILGQRPIDPSMDVDIEKGVMYVGALFDVPESRIGDKSGKRTAFEHNWVPVILSSSRKAYCLHQEHVDLLGYERLKGRVLPWRLEGLFGIEDRLPWGGLVAFLQEGYEADGSVYEAIRAKLEQYVYLPKAWQYDYLTAWVFGTYLFKVFPQYPILVLMSEKPGSGKSTLLTVLERVCFNAQRFNGFTESAVIRTANDSACTVLLDEAEILGRPQAVEGKIIELLNSRYEADALYRMSVQTRNKDWETKAFRLFGPTVIAKLKKGDVPQTIRSRGQTILMDRLPPGQQSIQLDHPRYDQDWPTMRSALYIWGLSVWQDVYDTYRNDANVRVGVNRQMDIWRIILSIAKNVSPECFEALRAEACRVPEKPEHEIPVLREHLDRCLQDGVLKVKVSEVARELEEVLPATLRRGGKPLCDALRKMGYVVKVSDGGSSCVFLSK